jgi:hypothetical protein
MITPREIIRDYLTVLNIMKDNAGTDFEELINVRSSQMAKQETEENNTENRKEKISIFDIDI